MVRDDDGLFRERDGEQRNRRLPSSAALRGGFRTVKHPDPDLALGRFAQGSSSDSIVAPGFQLVPLFNRGGRGGGALWTRRDSGCSAPGCARIWRGRTFSTANGYAANADTPTRAPSFTLATTCSNRWAWRA